MSTQREYVPPVSGYPRESQEAFIKSLFKLLTIACLCGAAYGQGVATFGAADRYDVDIVNLATLIPSLNIPVVSGHALIAPQACTIVGGSPTGTLLDCSDSDRFHDAIPGLLKSTLVSTITDSNGCKKGYVLYTSDGATGHPIDPNVIYGGGTCSKSFSQWTTDGSGYYLQFSPTSSTITATNGHVLVGLTETDPFGNVVTLTGGEPGTVTNALGASVYFQQWGFNVNSAPYIQWTDTTSISQRITMALGSQLTFSVANTCAKYSNSGGTMYPITQINYPDGTSINNITYEQGPGGAGTTTGRISSFTLRTGGTISYSYPPPCSGTTSTLTRTTPDGTTSYTRVAGATNTTTVLDPGNNKRLYYFVGGGTFLAGVDVYQNIGTVASPVYYLISSQDICYNTNNSSCRSASVAYPITQKDVYSYADTPRTPVSHATETFDSYGNVLSVSTYDYITGQTLTTNTAYGSWNGSGCTQPIGTSIYDHPCDVVSTDGTHTLSEARHTYNSEGAVTSSSVWTGSQWLITTSVPNSNGTAASITDPNGHVTSFGYAATGSGGCNGLLPTSTSTNGDGVIISTGKTWDCNGAVVLTTTDANGNTPPAIQYDAMFRPTLVTDNLGNSVFTTYSATSVMTTPSFGTPTTTYLDSLGRPIISQHQQSSGSPNYDTVSTSYLYNGPNRQVQTSSACTQNAGRSCAASVTKLTDPLGRPMSSTDVLSGTVTYVYKQNDSSVSIGPPPSGEHVKTVQTEVDGLGRTKSACALQSAGGTSCGQSMGNSGILTSYLYSFGLGTSTTSATRGVQTHTSIADALGRPLSVTTPESGTTTNAYDSGTGGCGAITSAGDLVYTTKASGQQECFYYDGLHRLHDVNGLGSYCRRYRYDTTANAVLGSSPAGVTVSNGVGRLIEAETDNCLLPIVITTDEWFSYDPNGRITDVWESTPHSGGYYHTSVTYNPNGTVSSISGIPTYTSSYTVGVDGEGRPNIASLGSTVVINGVTYDAAGRPLSVAIGTFGDSDTFTYDAVERMRTYNFTVKGKSQAGTLAWSPNGTLNQLSISDTFNASGAQTCNYLYDDFGRLGVPPDSPLPPPTPTVYSVDCGSSLWRQVFSYDQYNNLTKTGNPGMSWIPGYKSTNNQYIASSYDADGHVIYDGVNTYSWDAYGKMIGASAGAKASVCGTAGSCVTYDALGRIVETSTNAAYKEYLFGPIGRLAQMSGTTVTEVDLPLPGGLTLKAMGANGGGSKIVIHNDWLGSARLGTTLGSRAMTWDTAYGPYGETYDTFGTPKQDFTGDFQDIFAGLFDTPNRELSINSSRWLSPDPAGASWNAYSYPADPNTAIDPSGLFGYEVSDCGGAEMPCASGDNNYPAGMDDSNQEPPPAGMCGDAASPVQCSPELAGPPSKAFLVYSAPAQDFGGLNELMLTGGFWGERGVSGSDAALGLVGRAIGYSVSAGLSSISAEPQPYFVPYIDPNGQFTPFGGTVFYGMQAGVFNEENAVASLAEAKQYSVAFETELEPLGVGTRAAHFRAANKALAASVSADTLTEMGIEIPRSNVGTILGESPKGWTWHHVPGQPGVMQLVPRAMHAPGSIWQPLLHPGRVGGFKLWGGLY